MRSLLVILASVLATTNAQYTGSLSILSKLGASTDLHCNQKYASACSISTSTSINLAVKNALREASSLTSLHSLFDDVEFERYDSSTVQGGENFKAEV